MELSSLVRTWEIIAFIFFPACGFFLMPPTFKSYLKWRKTEKPRDFSSMVIQGFFALCFLISIFPLFVSRIVQIYSLNNRVYVFLASLVLGAFLGYWTLPKMLSYYQKLKAERTPVHFTLLVFFGFVSLYGLSSFFILVLYSALSITR